MLNMDQGKMKVRRKRIQNEGRVAPDTELAGYPAFFCWISCIRLLFFILHSFFLAGYPTGRKSGNRNHPAGYWISGATLFLILINSNFFVNAVGFTYTTIKIYILFFLSSK